MMDRSSEYSVKTTMVIRLIGGFSISNGQETISSTAWKSHRARNLVKLLALTPGHRLHRDQAIEVLWPDLDVKTATNDFHQALYSARRVLDQVLPGWLVLEEGFLSLANNLGHSYTIDVEAFEAAASRARESQDPAAYQAALELYAGELLPDDCYEAWTFQPREALRQTYLTLLLELAQLYEASHDYTRGISALQNLLAVDPSHEEAHQGLMRLYALSGQRQQALRQYQALRKVLQTELEVEPSPATLQLYESIQSGQIFKPVEIPTPPKQVEPTPRPHHNLPNRLSTFIGREKEIDQVIALLRGTRLLTVTGAGGVGKTSLALQTVSYLLEAFPDGVWLIELAPLANPELLPQVCVHTLDLIRQPDAPYLTILIQYLQKKHLLLILDNVEHLIAACGSLISELLKNCPRLTILTTSREVLNLPGESVFRVPSMTAPEPNQVVGLDQMAQYESVRLLVERARQISPKFELTRENAPAIAQICHRLDGIPLAIELAAGRVRLLSVDQIAVRLDHAFNLLTGGSREALPRHRTLKATIDWSYDLLTPKECLLLQRLSVFAGGWTLEAAEDVCKDDQLNSFEILDLLSALVDKSLIQVIQGADGLNRYRILETLLQYTRERLEETGDSGRVRDRHLETFAALTGQAEPHLRGKGQVEWLDRLESELDNLRAAMEWSQNGRIELGMKIAADLDWLWWIHGYYSEGRDWLKKLLSIEENTRKGQTLVGDSFDTNRVLQRARCLHVYNDVNLGNLLFTNEETIAILEESVSLLRQLGPPARRELARSIFSLLDARVQLEPPSSEKQEILEIIHEEGMQYEYSDFLNCLGLELMGKADFSQAILCMEESLAISREIEDLVGISSCTKFLAELYAFEGNYQKAELLARESIEISHRVKYHWWETYCYCDLIECELAQGNYEKAAEYSLVVQSGYWDVNEQGRAVVLLGVLQRSAWARGDYEEAVRLGNQIIKPMDIGVDYLSGKNKQIFWWEARLVKNKVMTYYFLGRVAQSRKELVQAETWIKKAILESIGNLDTAHFLVGAAVLFSLRGKYLQVVRLCGAADDIYQRIRLGLPLREREENDQALASARAALGEEAFTAAWKEGQSMTLEQAKAYALDEMGSSR